MDNKAFNQLSYGVYVIASGCADEKNAFVGTTAIQVSSDPTHIAVARLLSIGGSGASPGRCPFCSSTATPRSLFSNKT